MRSQCGHWLFCNRWHIGIKTTLFCTLLLSVLGPGAVSATAQTAPGHGSEAWRTVRGWTYPHNKGWFKVLFRGTELMPGAAGEAKVENKGNRTEIEAKFENMQEATQFGFEYLTYVLWAISPQGRAVNLGEVQLKIGSAKVKAVTDLQTFAMVVTAEPYFAVSQPGKQVVVENDIDARGESIGATYDLLSRDAYLSSNTTIGTAIFGIDRNTPTELFQARNAIRIAKNASAGRYEAAAIARADQQLQGAENAYRQNRGSKTAILMARDAVQTAEEARVMSLKQQAEEDARIQAEADRRAAQERTAKARAEAEEQANLRREAEQARLRAEAAKAEAERMKEEAMKAAAAAAKDKEDADRARQAAIAEQQAALEQKQAAEAEAERARQAAEKAEAEKGDLRAQLLEQLNSIMQTNDSARGLIVNMSDVLFDTGSYILKPGAREKLAKISGILLAHPGLTMQVEGHTDSVGSDELNQRLSEQRAGIVRDYMLEQGVLPSSITAQGFGKTQPVASNDTAEGRQRNRRVEIVVNGDSIGTPVAGATRPLN